MKMNSKRLRLILAALAVGLCLPAMAAAQGENLPRVTLEEFKQLLAKNAVVVVDVRNGEIESKIKGAAHIPEVDLQARLEELPRDREIVTYCA